MLIYFFSLFLHELKNMYQSPLQRKLDTSGLRDIYISSNFEKVICLKKKIIFLKWFTIQVKYKVNELKIWFQENCLPRWEHINFVVLLLYYNTFLLYTTWLWSSTKVFTRWSYIPNAVLKWMFEEVELPLILPLQQLPEVEI